jgi:hypothetical protein
VSDISGRTSHHFNHLSAWQNVNCSEAYKGATERRLVGQRRKCGDANQNVKLNVPSSPCEIWSRPKFNVWLLAHSKLKSWRIQNFKFVAELDAW